MVRNRKVYLITRTQRTIPQMPEKQNRVMHLVGKRRRETLSLMLAINIEQTCL